MTPIQLNTPATPSSRTIAKTAFRLSATRCTAHGARREGGAGSRSAADSHAPTTSPLTTDWVAEGADGAYRFRNRRSARIKAFAPSHPTGSMKRGRSSQSESPMARAMSGPSMLVTTTPVCAAKCTRRRPMKYRTVSIVSRAYGPRRLRRSSVSFWPSMTTSRRTPAGKPIVRAQRMC